MSETARECMKRSRHIAGSLQHCISQGLAVVALITLMLTFARAGNQASRRSTPRLEQLKAEHLRILEQLNQRDGRGNVMELDDPRIPALLKKGWGLAGAWAAEYLEIHPGPSRRELKVLFKDFAPKPQGLQVQVW